MINIKNLGQQEYVPTWEAMQQFTNERSAETVDELWIVEHPPVFTLGLAGREEHILNPHQIPVIRTDRGGQVTYHGPGQIVIYLLLDLRRREGGIRNLVCDIEKAIIDFLATYHIAAELRTHAPGVYVAEKKIASIGLRVRRNCTFHGISFNYAMDLTPFSYINPCGFAGLQMTQLAELIELPERQQTETQLVNCLVKRLQQSPPL